MTPIRAAQEVRGSGVPLVLLVVGDGPMRQHVEDLSGVSTNGAVRILGFLSDVRRILVAADFFVLSSLREGLSFSLLEAMALGLPAVVSDAAANAEAVGDSGIVVPYGDVDRFAGAFRRLMDEFERATLGRRARERVEDHFRAEDMVRRTRDVYDAVVASGGISLRRRRGEVEGCRGG
ncbi:MAG: glycosyltransferase [Actinomycetota bacterium]|nr:glycosyltransferase [Actinomycetota bacterium]